MADRGAGAGSGSPEVPAGQPASRVIEIESEEEFRRILSTEPRVVADFYTQWCAPCKRIAPFYSELSARNRNIVFVRVDVGGEELADLGTRAGADKIPFFVSYYQGKKADHCTGENKTALCALVQMLTEFEKYYV